MGRAVGASFDEIDTGEETVWIVPGAGHTGAFRTQPDAYVEKLIKFYEAHQGAPHNSHASDSENQEAADDIRPPDNPQIYEN